MAEDAWYGANARWAADLGVVTGVGKDLFAPDRNITREQIVTMLYRYAAAQGFELKSNRVAMEQFSDAADVSDWAVEAMAWAVSNGILNGSNGRLLPQHEATRAQTAKLLISFMDQYGL